VSEPGLERLVLKVVAVRDEVDADKRSPDSSVFEHPYCGAIGENHVGTTLFTNGSLYHSETSWLKASMSSFPGADSRRGGWRS
jgi:hypothetical protein